MASRVILFFIIIAVAAGCASSLGEDTLTDVLNITAVGKHPGICSKCICKDGKVDCSSKGLTKFFPQHKWAALKNFRPTIVDMSNNSFERITLMAELPIEVLNLSRCGIQAVEFAAFRPLRNMRVLDLSHNKVRTLLTIILSISPLLGHRSSLWTKSGDKATNYSGAV
ncbi:hypothetical protein evm_015404 [Chilo suppressalis]|nr:hypothetical protein evm_015404 [Chilo suppressalis]